MKDEMCQCISYRMASRRPVAIDTNMSGVLLHRIAFGVALT
jgi:hypothetical protein